MRVRMCVMVLFLFVGSFELVVRKGADAVAPPNEDSAREDDLSKARASKNHCQGSGMHASMHACVRG